MSEQLKIYLAYIAICTIWGSTWLVIKVGLETMTPFLSAGLRFIVAGIVLFAIIKVRNVPIPWDRKTLGFLVMVALTSFSVPFALVYWGQQSVSSGVTSILFAVFPFCVAIMSTLMLPNERLTAAKIIGIIIGFSGIVLIFSDDISIGTGQEQVLGMIAIVTSALIQAFSAVMIKKHGHSISPFIVTFIPMSLAGIFLVTGSVLTEDLSRTEFTPIAIFSVIFLAVFGSVATFVSYFWLLKRVEVVLLSLTSFVTPVIAVFLGVIILNERISSQLFAGSALVLSGILAANAVDIRKYLRSRFSSS
jgi:drug/metabolite transporter (DMT)-like permease